MRILSISVEKLMNNLSAVYRVRLVAGKKGIYNTNINWVSVVEDYNPEKIENTNQIIITSGMKSQSNRDLLELAKRLYKIKTCALVINMGKYIKSIPENLKDFCNSVDMPLYTMPWEVIMSDVAKEILRAIMWDETKNLNVAEIIQSIIFNTENLLNQINKLSLYGFSNESMYCPIIIKVENSSDNDLDMLLRSVKNCCDRTAKEIGCIVVSFVYNNILAIILVNSKNEKINPFINIILDNFIVRFFNSKVHVCVGRNDRIYNLSVNFKRLLPIMNVAVKNDIDILFYDKMGIYRILSEVSDINILKDMYRETIGRLIKYDAENNTDLTDYIKNYILCDGNVQTVANNFYVHRNTVNNKLNKIKEITQINPLTLDGKIVFSTAIKISELYNL